jgi:predicted nucleotide-binding protein
MYHLLVSYSEDSWDESPATISRSRFLEYTDNEITSRFAVLNSKKLNELTEFPVIFMCENEVSPTFLGKITKVTEEDSHLSIHFERIKNIPDFDKDVIPSISSLLDIDCFEFTRTHWAIKDIDLYFELISSKILQQNQLSQHNSPDLSPNVAPTNNKAFNDQQIFIVHGHDELAKIDVKDFVISIKKDPIILHMLASMGMTIIEKIDHYSNVGFAIVIYTECDIGAKNGSLTYKRRARQNVVFEHGYLIGKIGRERVVALVKGDIERPNDISGIVYIQMDDDTWEEQLKRELENCEYI